MAYMNQEMKKTIAIAMKPVLKKYGVKATLSVENLSTIHLNIKSSKFDFMKQAGYDGKYMTVNPYSYERDFSGECLEFLKEAHNVLLGAGWYNNSDSQSDYFDIAYYYYVNVGRWNTPYEMVK